MKKMKYLRCLIIIFNILNIETNALISNNDEKPNTQPNIFSYTQDPSITEPQKDLLFSNATIFSFHKTIIPKTSRDKLIATLKEKNLEINAKEQKFFNIAPSFSTKINNERKCSIFHKSESINHNKVHCNGTWDGFLCWPSVPAGHIALLHCPDINRTIEEHYATRKCDSNGYWEQGADQNINGLTNFADCLSYNLRKNVGTCSESGTCDDTYNSQQMKILELKEQLTYFNISPEFSDEISSESKCSIIHESEIINRDIGHCNGTWDGFLCWPSIPAGHFARLHCPDMVATIKNHYATRKCDFNGNWISKTEKHTTGWTNFTDCLSDGIKEILGTCTEFGTCNDIIKTAERTRILETIGLMLSFFTLLVSLIIFFNFQSLKNSRTKIHKNLFIAMEIQVIVRLILYLDQYINRSNTKNPKVGSIGIENTPYLCECSYFLLEYARTSMFLWMLIEGIYLHSGVTWISGTRTFPYFVYAFVGWGTPLLMTLIWEFITVKFYKGEKCLNYNLTPYYFILEGPRNAVILLNLFFLLNIIRVLVVKLRQSHSSDLDQVRKAVRAAIVLLPLLGIAHLLFYFAPTNRSAVVFAIWSYTAHFFSSFQGFFVALIYCFMNGEVRTAVTRGFSIYMSIGNRRNWITRRTSVFSGSYNRAAETATHANHSRALSEHPSNQTNCNSLSERTSIKKKNWIISLCTRCHAQNEQPTSATAESVVFELSEQ